MLMEGYKQRQVISPVLQVEVLGSKLDRPSTSAARHHYGVMKLSTGEALRPVKVKLSLCRPGQDPRVPGGWGSQISR
jgi:hypothetical protein